MSLRKQDYQSEKAVADFLDAYFYPNQTTKFHRFESLNHQLKGIDVQFDFESYKQLIVDEKTAAHFVNKNIPTFAFEIDFIGSDNQLKTGWLVDSEKSTQAYLLSWIWAKKERNFEFNDIEYLEIILIQRAVIMDLLKKHGVDESRLNRVSKKMRQGNLYGPRYKHRSRPFYFNLTKHLAEKPCNVVIHKSKLIELAELHQLVRKN